MTSITPLTQNPISNSDSGNLVELYQALANQSSQLTQPKDLERQNIATKLQNQNIWEKLKQDKVFSHVIEQYEGVMGEISEAEDKLKSLYSKQASLEETIEDLEDFEDEVEEDDKVTRFQNKLRFIRDEIAFYEKLKDKKQKSLLNYWKMMGVTESIVGASLRNEVKDTSSDLISLLSKMANTANTTVNHIPHPQDMEQEIIEVPLSEKEESKITNFLENL